MRKLTGFLDIKSIFTVIKKKRMPYESFGKWMDKKAIKRSI